MPWASSTLKSRGLFPSWTKRCAAGKRKCGTRRITVIQAKIELNQLRNQRIGDRRPDTTFQEKVLRRAQAKLEFAEEKLAATKRWQRDLPHELMNYEGPARQLQNALEGDVPRMIAFLERKIAALEAYLQGKPS